MQMLAEKKCTIRIAFSEVTDLLLKSGIDSGYNPEIESIRVSQTMQVDMLELEENSFRIRSISRADQFLDPDTFTEWTFMVMPLKKGHFSLLLKVSVIEYLQNFGERKKELVFDKQIDVVNEAADEITDFEEYNKANLFLAGNGKTHRKPLPEMRIPELQTVPISIPDTVFPPQAAGSASQPAPAPPRRPVRRMFSGGAIAATLVAACAMVYFLTQFTTSSRIEDVAYNNATHSTSSVITDSARIKLPAKDEKPDETVAIHYSPVIQASDIMMRRSFPPTAGKTTSLASNRHNLQISFRLNDEGLKKMTGDNLFYVLIKDPNGNMVTTKLRGDNITTEPEPQPANHASKIAVKPPDSAKTNIIRVNISRDSIFRPGRYEISIYHDGKIVGSQNSVLGGGLFE